MTTVLVDKLDKRVVADAEARDSQRRATSCRGLRGLDLRRRVRLWQRQDYVSARPRGGARWTGAILLAVATALVVAVAASAQTYDPPITTLVKNTDQLSERVVLLNEFQDGLNQAFRTGPNLGGYELTSILLHVHDTHESRYMLINAGIYLYNGSGESGFTRVTDLIRGQLDDYAYNEWWAPENTYLEPDTEYYFLLDCTAGCANDNIAQFRTTYSSEDDPGAEEGWDIHDHLGFRSAGDPDWKWDARLILRIEIKGRPSVGPAALSVADARTTEETDATLEFAVTLSQAASETVTVDYATADGTAQTGQDYTATDGTLTFAAGETQKTVSVAVLDDAHDEGEETLTLTLSNASGARIADNVATGTIANEDPLQQAWLARFGRTAAQRVLDGVQARLRAPHESGIRATVAGHDLSGAGEVAAQDRFKAQSEWGRSEATEGQFGSQSLTMRDLMTGSAFTLSSETVGGLGTLWGRGAYSGFGGSANGLSLDGGMMTGMFGADYAIGRWVVGLPLSHSRGDGSWYSADRGAGNMASSLTGLYPYVWLRTRGASVAVGHGRLRSRRPGVDDAERGIAPHRDGPDDGGGRCAGRPRLRTASGRSVAGDSSRMRCWCARPRRRSSDPSGLLAAAVADVSRLRLGLESSLELGLAGGRLLTPTVELGLRHDGGDAETGFGVELGGGTVFADAARGLMAQVRVRGLVAHEAADFRDWRVSGSLRFDPTPSSALGPVVALTPSWGGASSGGVAALLGRETLVGLAANDAPASVGRLDAEAAYGLVVFGGRATGTPYLRVGQSEAFREVRMGCRLEFLRWEQVELGIEGMRRESTVDNMAPDREVMLHLAMR